MHGFIQYVEWKQGSPGLIPITPENLAKAKLFAMEKWKERARERGQEEPADLTDACKFCSLFAQRLFGGRIEGNWHHQYVRIDDQIIDLTDAVGVKIGNPYFHDRGFWGNKEHKESMASCEARVNQWVQEFMTTAGIPPKIQARSANRIMKEHIYRFGLHGYIDTQVDQQTRTVTYSLRLGDKKWTGDIDVANAKLSPVHRIGVLEFFDLLGS